MNNPSDCRDRQESIALMVMGDLETSLADELLQHTATCRTCRHLRENLAGQEDGLLSTFHVIEQRLERRKPMLIRLTEDYMGRRMSYSRTLRWSFAAAAAILSGFSTIAKFTPPSGSVSRYVSGPERSGWPAAAAPLCGTARRCGRP